LIKAIGIDDSAPFPEYLVDSFFLTQSHKAAKNYSMFPLRIGEIPSFISASPKFKWFSFLSPSLRGFVSLCDILI